MRRRFLIIPTIVAIGFAVMILERLFPDQKLPVVKGWWIRVLVINFLQLLVVILAEKTWNRWFAYSVFQLGDRLAHPWAALCSYLCLTFVFYWWHRLRHDINFFWLLCHQLHHSPSRIETITSFYKHPVELILNGILIALINFGIFGLDTSGAAWVTFYTALAEFFYHMNIKTPQWIGFLIQRPEMHRIHHQRGLHYYNFADLPLWDMLFGTFRNPIKAYHACGFSPEREARWDRMLYFINVNKPLPNSEKRNTIDDQCNS
jgi:sterol desaturase/sphingolipid hydroxylase (fatty acid hydroxylase superfamily)